MSQQYWKHNLS
uniref:Uncharacterized protein n=1 Tax=Moniliophthora roreri TaxID=221103 RepID=A0A0W0G0L3_MONRR